MGERTGIAWADSTANSQMGCDGCELWDPSRGVRICYAGGLTERMVAAGPRNGWPAAFNQPRLFPERIEQACAWKDLTGTKRPGKPWLDGLPRVIFWNDMGDAFTASLPIDWWAPYLPRLAKSPHIHLWLTKRADRQAEFAQRFRLPENVWCGVSVTSPQDQRLRRLLKTRAAKLYVSYEPALQPVDPARWPGIHWWILGGASAQRGQVTPPTELSVLREALDGCRTAGAAGFVKQLGSVVVIPDVPIGLRGLAMIAAAEMIDREWPVGTRFGNPTGKPELNGRVALLRDPKGADWDEWPAAVRRREMPR